MSTATDLQNNEKPIIRKITKGKVLTINIPIELSRKGSYREGQYVYSFLDKRNRLVFSKVSQEGDNEK